MSTLPLSEQDIGILTKTSDLLDKLIKLAESDSEAQTDSKGEITEPWKSLIRRLKKDKDEVEDEILKRLNH